MNNTELKLEVASILFKKHHGYNEDGNLIVEDQNGNHVAIPFDPLFSATVIVKIMKDFNISPVFSGTNVWSVAMDPTAPQAAPRKMSNVLPKDQLGRVVCEALVKIKELMDLQQDRIAKMKEDLQDSKLVLNQGGRVTPVAPVSDEDGDKIIVLNPYESDHLEGIGSSTSTIH